MRGKAVPFDSAASYDRIEKIFDLPAGQFDKSDGIPADSNLTYENGFYVSPSAMMVDIRDSSSLNATHNRPVVAKLYRAYLSEVCGLMDAHQNCTTMSIRGDGVLGVFDTPLKVDINGLFDTAAKIYSTIKVLNYLARKKGYSTLRIGIGLAYGEALMVKAGFNGSGIYDTIWLGDVVNKAAHLSDHGSKQIGDPPVMIATDFYNNLKEIYKTFCKWDDVHECYQACIVNVMMEAWYTEHCQ